MRKFWLTTLCALALLTGAAAPAAAQETGSKTDKAVEKTKDGVKEVGDKAEDVKDKAAKGAKSP